MRIRIPPEVVEQGKEETYCRAYWEGYNHLKRPSAASFEHSEAIRALMPEAFDAGELAAYFEPKVKR